MNNAIEKGIKIGVAGIIGAAGAEGVKAAPSSIDIATALKNQPPAIVESIGSYDSNKPLTRIEPATATPLTGETKEQQVQVQQATEVYSITLSPEQNKEVLNQLGTWGKEIAAKEGDPSVRIFRVPLDYDRNAVKSLVDYKLPLIVDPKTGQPYTQELSYFLAGIPGAFTQGGLIDAVYTGQQLPNGQEKWTVLFQVKEENKVFNMKAGALIFMDQSTRVTDPNKPVNIVNVDNNVERLTLTTTIADERFIYIARWANPDVFQNVKPGDELVVYVDKDNKIRRLVSGTPDKGIRIVEFRQDVQGPSDAGTQETTTVNGETIPLTVTAVPTNPDHSGYLDPGGATLSKYQTTPEALAVAGKARILTPKEIGSEFVSGIEVRFADGRKFTIKTDLPSFAYTDYVKVALFREELQQLGILDLHKKNFEVIIANADKKAYGPAGNWITWRDDKGEFEAIGYVNKVQDKGDRMQYVVYWSSRYVEALKTDKRGPWMLQSAGNSEAFYAIIEHQVGVMGMIQKLDQVTSPIGPMRWNPFKLESR